ncbi:Cytochrome P450 714C2 [Vitis vinifera]|uniref:Cytochrome P450 714C2 n=1 Tax=Vitis vinifera TaxID=29760 RepID=A0A438GRX5_VITVI|nr:Cytochrome P450 714C2 [Vitis vinifera]
MEAFTVKLFISIALVGVLGLFFRLYNALVVKPKKLRSILRNQGISGPPPSFLLGNIREIKESQSTAVKDSCTDTHNCAAALFPFFEKWRNKYGQVFMFSLGNTQILHVNQPDIVKEITTCTSLDFGKPSYQHRELGPLLGQGILTSNGAVWAHNRKSLLLNCTWIRSRYDYGMIGLITESVDTLLKTWRSMIEAEGGIADIRIDEHMRSFSGDVISRACFGSSYTKGEEIFLRLRALQEAMSKKIFLDIPGMRYVPTKHNRDVWELEKDVRNLILKVVSGREELAAHEKDLLQMVLEGAKNSDLSQEAIDNFIVDNCKNIYLAGYETTAVSAEWCLMLLAANPDWQARVREEVVEICKGRTPDADMIRKMKQMTMVIHESLRLYPPVAVVSREALADMKFGGIHVPKGVNVWSLVVTLHTDPENWGPDALKFNPERFANGITGACKLPHLYMPFGLVQGCALARIWPWLVIEPENGVDLLVKKL